MEHHDTLNMKINKISVLWLSPMQSVSRAFMAQDFRIVGVITTCYSHNL